MRVLSILGMYKDPAAARPVGVTLALHPSRTGRGTALQVAVEAHGALHLKSYGIHHEQCFDHPIYGAALWAVEECRLYGDCNHPC